MSKSIATGMAPTFESSVLTSTFAGIAGWLTAPVAGWMAARRARRAVATLNDQMLADIGLERSIARPAERYQVSARMMSDLMSMR